MNFTRRITNDYQKCDPLQYLRWWNRIHTPPRLRDLQMRCLLCWRWPRLPPPLLQRRRMLHRHLHLQTRPPKRRISQRNEPQLRQTLWLIYLSLTVVRPLYGMKLQKVMRSISLIVSLIILLIIIRKIIRETTSKLTLLALNPLLHNISAKSIYVKANTPFSLDCSVLKGVFLL